MTGRDFLPPTGVELVFLLMGVVAVGSGLLVVLTRHLVHAALWLVVCLGALAGCYLLLTAEFVAWVQVLIYVGAVTVLLMFGLMLTRAPTGASDDLTGPNKFLAMTVALATASVLVSVMVVAFGDVYVDLDPPAPMPVGAEQPGAGSAESVGSAIFRHWVLPFEVLSVLLLAALVGAIVLSRRDIETPAEQAP